MSKNLHVSIIQYFQSRMNWHNKVDTFKDISTGEFYIYRIFRKDGLPSLVVWLSDAYDFSKGEYLARPKSPKIDYILIARPEASDNEPVSYNLNGVGVGNIAGFMGALNKPRVCEYLPPNKRNKK